MQYLIKYGITKYFESVSYMSRGTEIVYIKFVLKCLKYMLVFYFCFLFLFDICTLAFFNKIKFWQEKTTGVPFSSIWRNKHCSWKIQSSSIWRIFTCLNTYFHSRKYDSDSKWLPNLKLKMASNEEEHVSYSTTLTFSLFLNVFGRLTWTRAHDEPMCVHAESRLTCS